MRIRCAQSDDFCRIVTFYKEVIESTQEINKYARWIYGLHPTDEIILNYIDNHEMYLLEVEQKIIGAMALTMHQGEDYHPINWKVEANDDEVVVIHILAVHPEYQKQGIGKILISDSIQIAEKKTKKAVRLDALASNIPAHRMYQSCGFMYRGKQHLYAENIGWTDFLYFEYIV